MRARNAAIVAVAVLAAAVTAAAVWLWVAREADTDQVLLPAGSLWRFDDSGKDPGVAWRQADYDDSTWPMAAAPFGYGRDVTTEVSYGDDPGAKHTTTYFRTGVQVPEGTQGIELRIERDDGAIIYLNGTEVLRTGVPEGRTSAGTAARYAQEGGETWITAELPRDVVAPGPNSVAVEVHQSSPGSGDLFFDLEIAALDEPPIVNEPVPAGATRVLAAGDIGECGGAAGETAEILEAVPGPFLALGDIAYPKGAPQDYTDCYDPDYGQFRDRTSPVPGNHDYMTDDGRPYFDYFGDAAGTPEQSWYSQDIGGWHLVHLNSNCEFVGGCDEKSPQYRWLVDDLARAQPRCLAATWHHPRYSSSEYGDNEDVSPLYRAMVAAGGDFVLNGHAHFYERYPRMSDANTASESGMREFIVGTGGANLYEFAEVNPSSEVRWNQGHGVLQLDLKPDGYDWRFIATDPAIVVDSGTDTC